MPIPMTVYEFEEREAVHFQFDDYVIEWEGEKYRKWVSDGRHTQYVLTAEDLYPDDPAARERRRNRE